MLLTWHISLAYANCFEKNTKLKLLLQKLSITNPPNKQHNFTIQNFGQITIIRESQYKLMDMFDFSSSDIQKQSFLISNAILKKLLTSPQIFPTGFKRFFSDQVIKAVEYLKMTNRIMQKFEILSNLPEEPARWIFLHLNLTNMLNLKNLSNHKLKMLSFKSK